MKRNVLLIFLWASLYGVHAQVTLSGTVLDSKTAGPVDYVNIGLVNKAQGTVSDMDGTFELRVIQASKSDTVRISRIGYRPMVYTLGELESALSRSPIISLDEERTALDEVVISQKEAMKNRIGFTYFTEDLVAYWNNRRALGGEHASKILVRKGPLKLEDLSFQVIRNISDSLLVRVNVYEIDKGLPGRNITRENILYTLKEKSGQVIIDLSPYDIVVDDHFIVSLEMLKVYGDKVGMTIAAYNDGYRSYSRLISQDRWRRMRKGTTIAYNLNTSAVEKSQFTPISTKEKNPKPELVTILWDNSLSMKDRDLEKELEYMEQFFKKIKMTKVHFQTFGYELGKKQVFQVRNGNWSTLRELILKTPNDGGSRKQVLEILKPEEFTLIFTDGQDFFDDIHRNWEGKIYPISSSMYRVNHELLAEIANEQDADYINLADRYDLDRVSDYKRMQGNYVSNTWADNRSISEFKIIKGNVSDYEDNLEKVLVQVKNSDRKTRTDAEGNFQIEALPGETLVFTYPGRITVEALVNSGTRFLTIAMPLGVKVLDEVVLSEIVKIAPVSKGVYGEKEKINTNFGVLDPATSGFGVRQIKGEDLFQGAANIVEALDGKFSGIRVIRDYSQRAQLIPPDVGSRDDPQGVSRPRNMFREYVPLIGTRDGFAAWDVDGHFYKPEDVPYHILMPNIKSITIMPGSWAASKYGKEANGGIVIVRTISNSFDDLKARKVPLEDQARLKDNYYEGDAVFPQEQPKNQPKYLREILASTSETGAYDIYLEERHQWMFNPHYFADMHDYFHRQWDASERARLIVSGIREINDKDIDALRLLAYKYDEQKEYLNALEIYQQITLQAAEQLQSIRDLAKAYSNTGDYQEAWEQYNNYLEATIDTLSDKGLDQIVRQEMLTLVEKHHNIIDLNKNSFKFDHDKEDISIIVQWNNPNAEFELQFVGPTDQYYLWKHTELDNAALLYEERIDGSFSNSFGIQDIGEGPWKINTKYIGNKENTPTYLKFTIINHLKSSETIKVLKLQKSNINYRSFDISKDEIISAFK